MNEFYTRLNLLMAVDAFDRLLDDIGPLYEYKQALDECATNPYADCSFALSRYQQERLKVLQQLTDAIDKRVDVRVMTILRAMQIVPE